MSFPPSYFLSKKTLDLFLRFLFYIFRNNTEIVSNLLNNIFNKPENAAQIVVKYTAIKLVGELAKWVDNNPQILGMMIILLGRLYY